MTQLNLITKDLEQEEQRLHKALHLLRAGYEQNQFPSLEERKALLLSLKDSLLEHQDALVKALSDDFELRSEFDSAMTDIMPTLAHINYTLKHLKSWMKPSKRSSGLLMAPSKVEVQYQPVGVVGIISPWNFPIILSLAPVATAFAAGNKVMLKLSEYTPHTNEVVGKIIEPLKEHIYLIEGDASVASIFSGLRFDHLLFTGSTQVGRLVAQSAAKNLVPVTLELGGKSPVVVTPSSNLDKVIDQIVFGKCVNAGQICVAPDYVLIEQDKIDAFAELFVKHFITLYGENPNDFTHIINDGQYQRLKAAIEEAEKDQSTRVVSVSDYGLSDSNRRILPHLIINPSLELKVMTEEIFGPVLPIVGYQKLEDAVEFINQRERPLALYIMSEDDSSTEFILKRTHSGGVAVNDTILHVARKMRRSVE
ncbi:aldehyde dehydrogenase [Vibrio ishigakensis]|uniref:Aldehyde dehydrogenase n=1 Tax=Vibrio ishigakensis TaxID=1481914 RepID=A0A0B8P271_9VIBR|nr:aldehyde dehydrogenase [Vibrio ishigakensis]